MCARHLRKQTWIVRGICTRFNCLAQFRNSLQNFERPTCGRKTCLREFMATSFTISDAGKLTVICNWTICCVLVCQPYCHNSRTIVCNLRSQFVCQLHLQKKWVTGWNGLRTRAAMCGRPARTTLKEAAQIFALCAKGTVHWTEGVWAVLEEVFVFKNTWPQN